jgi:hypothetical protein
MRIQPREADWFPHGRWRAIVIFLSPATEPGRERTSRTALLQINRK